MPIAPPISNFNPRAPYGARPEQETTETDIKRDFNPRAPYGARPPRPATVPAIQPISIHAPHTGRDSLALIFCLISLTFQSTRPIRGATNGLSNNMLCNDISIHAPHTGRDSTWGAPSATCWGFQSTRPIRGATRPACARPCRRAYFNPRAPYGARLKINIMLAVAQDISIHAPHTGRDYDSQQCVVHDYPFQSTRPIRGATVPRSRV